MCHKTHDSRTSAKWVLEADGPSLGHKGQPWSVRARVGQNEAAMSAAKEGADTASSKFSSQKRV